MQQKTIIMRSIFILLVGFSLAGCQFLSLDDDSERETVLIIRSGESFGLCAGYCLHELEMRNSVTRISSRGWIREQVPDRRVEEETDERVWDEVQSLLDLGVFRQMDEVYGCPDCADGGSEWVEIEDGSTVQRVTFEYGKSPEELQPLFDKLRELRTEWKKKNFPEG